MIFSPEARVDLMISRRVSMVSFAWAGETWIFSEIFSMSVVLVQVNLGGVLLCWKCLIGLLFLLYLGPLVNVVKKLIGFLV